VTYKRKLIEVALPLEAINRESVREGYIYRGNPSAIHKWWAQRPLAACRAVLFASLVDDPSAHPDRFPTEEAQQEERERLFRIIEDLVRWENATNADVLKAARVEIMASCDGNPPPVLDPFCGGGSIPLEAQRLGLQAHAGDLNPVAVLITRALIEIPSRFAGRPPVHPDDGSAKQLGSWEGARGLAEDIRYYGRWMREEAERRIGQFYPKVKLPPERGGGQATVIAWIWARTVRSPNPAWDGPTPLVRSFALSTKRGKEVWAQPIVDREHRRIHFKIRTGLGWPDGTVGRGGAICLATGTPVPIDYIRAEGKAGRLGYQLMAIVIDGPRGRAYLPPDDEQELVAASPPASKDAPEALMPANPRWFSPPSFGLVRFADVFTRRQLMALCSFSDLIAEARNRVVADGGGEAYADAVTMFLAFAVDKVAEYGCTLVPWYSKEDRPKGVFARQAIPMVWDFAEVNALGKMGGTFDASVRIVADSLAAVPTGSYGDCRQLDACQAEWTPSSVMVATDPPYYDNIGYADLSDFFYIWLRRSLKEVFPSELSTLLAPKTQELIADPYRFSGERQTVEEHFEEGLGAALDQMRKAQLPEYPLTAFYAFKQAEEDKRGGRVASTGWETMLEGLLHAGLSVHGTWPMRSERGGRSNDIGANALASSIVLVCRPRPENAPLAVHKEFLATLKSELPSALRHLQQGNIAPVDLAQAAIGPGMGIFSRYARVIEADGRPMTVRTALGLINHVLDETLAEQEADFDAETRWALAWFEQHGMNPGPFGVAETLSKAKNTAVNGLVTAGILSSRAGKVRLLDRNELPVDWNPATDRRLTVWEVTQHLHPGAGYRRRDQSGRAATSGRWRARRDGAGTSLSPLHPL
jgi:putative DNA methylase